MDYFKIFTIIFMIVMTYLMFKIYLEKCNKEGFADVPTQSLGGVDDTNAINTLAQIAKNLMAGGATVPGNLIVKGGSIATGDAPGQTPGTIISNMGDSWGMLWGSNCALIGQKGKTMRFGFADAYNAAGWDEKMNIQPDGTVNIKGRNILAELDKLNSRWSGDNLVVPGHLTVKNGSNFTGGRHWFKDEENAGRLRVGAAYGVPGIWGEDTGGLVHVANFQIGTQRAGDNNSGGMVADKTYDFIRSRNPSYAILGPSNTGQLGMAWNNGRMYWTFLEKNQRNWNADYGNLVN
jgi:hypothetical protein